TFILLCTTVRLNFTKAKVGGISDNENVTKDFFLKQKSLIVAPWNYNPRLAIKLFYVTKI
uniref:hypothetical protein n=1 Tax=Hoylesella nanceiensis TaxID=425941 RepID=UPI0024307A31